MKFEIWVSRDRSHEHDAQMDDARSDSVLVDAVDASCNRFRDDSELRDSTTARRDGDDQSYVGVGARGGTARGDVTGSMVDPTVLPALLALGYDRDFDELATSDPIVRTRRTLDGTSSIHLDLDQHTVALDPPCQLDLGASAKALVVDSSPMTSRRPVVWSSNSAATSPFAAKDHRAPGRSP